MVYFKSLQFFKSYSWSQAQNENKLSCAKCEEMSFVFVCRTTPSNSYPRTHPSPPKRKKGSSMVRWDLGGKRKRYEYTTAA